MKRIGCSLAWLAAALAAPVWAQIQLSARADLGRDEFLATDVTQALQPVKRRSVVLPRDQAARAAVPDPARRLALQVTPAQNPDELSADARRRMDVIAQALKGDELGRARFIISGHTDTRGDHDSNVALSKRWADAVRSYLVTVHHVEPQRLEAVGRGPDEPLEPAYPENPSNRRVQVVAID